MVRELYRPITPEALFEEALRYFGSEQRYAATVDLLCPHCGYVIRSLSSTRCPECGRAIRETASVNPR